MTDSLTIDDTNFISAAEAAKRFGYTSDYIGKLAREDRVSATRVGRRWYVSLESVEKFVEESKQQKVVRGETIREERKVEQQAYQKKISAGPGLDPAILKQSRVTALAQTASILFIGLVFGMSGYFASTQTLTQAATTIYTGHNIFEQFAIAFYRLISPEEKGVLVAVESAEETSRKDMDQSDTAEPGVEAAVTMEETILFVSQEDEFDDERIKQIEEAFSDEVTVTLDENNPSTGIIVPEFRSGTGSEYHFLVVPINQPDQQGG